MAQVLNYYYNYLSTAHGNPYTILHQSALIVAGSFCFVTFCISFFLNLQHLRSYNNPDEQMWIVAVLFIVPVYAIESIISLAFPRLSLACDTLRNCYEAFALYSFGSYLIACLGGETNVIELLENESRKQLSKPLLECMDENQSERHWSLRNFFFQPCTLGRDLLVIEKFGLVQYMILKTFCAFLALVLELCGVYGDGEFKWYYGYPYLAVVLNFSQMWALYCLVQFYKVTHERLKRIKPLAKFISFKAIVFATWWQGVGIALLCATGVISKKGKLQNAIQDFLICIEMAIASVAHMFVFSAEPYHFNQHYQLEPEEAITETTEAKLKLEEGNSQTIIEKKENKVEAHGTSVTESVHDIFVEGGHQVVDDVVLTINQAIGPVEKGVTKIQETFHHKSVASVDQESETELEVEEHIEEKITCENVKQ